MATIEVQTNELIERTYFPLIKEKCYFRLLDNDYRREYNGHFQYDNNSPAQITNQTDLIKNTPWIGSGAIGNCCFYIAFTYDEECPISYLIAHVLPSQYPPEGLEQYKDLVLVTSDVSHMMKDFQQDFYQDLKSKVKNFRHFHIEVDSAIYVYFNTESGALCIESKDALYMSKEPLYSPRAHDQDLQRLQSWLIESTHFQKRRTYWPFFSNTTNCHAQEMSQAPTFEEIRNIGRKALREKPFLGRDELVTEYYERLANSASAGEFSENIASYNASFEPILGSNKQRNNEEYVKPGYDKHWINFRQTFEIAAAPDEGSEYGPSVFPLI